MFKKKNKYEADAKLLGHIRGPAVKYVSLRRGDDPVEAVLGKNGAINFVNDRVTVVCEEGVVLDRPLSQTTVGELMSREGATFSFINDEGVRETVIAYYTYYRK